MSTQKQMAKKIIPSCRACGCTDDCACPGGCSWARVEKGSPPLCSACVGTADDMVEVLVRIKADRPNKAESDVIIKAAIARRAKRFRKEMPW